MVESFSQTSPVEILASIRWPHTMLSKADRQWILAPLGSSHSPLDNQPIGAGIAALMIRDAHEILDTKNEDCEQIARQALTEGYIRTTVQLASLFDRSQTIEQVAPRRTTETNVPLSVALGTIEATKRFAEMLAQVASVETIAA